MGKPTRSVRVLDEQTFRLGRCNAQEGGTKGIDIHDEERVLAATSEHRPLAFYDLDALSALRPLEIDGEIAGMSRERDRELARSPWRSIAHRFRRAFGRVGRFGRPGPGRG